MFELLIIQGQHHVLLALIVIVVLALLLASFFHRVGHTRTRNEVHKNSYIKPYEPSRKAKKALPQSSMPKW